MVNRKSVCREDVKAYNVVVAAAVGELAGAAFNNIYTLVGNEISGNINSLSANNNRNGVHCFHMSDCAADGLICRDRSRVGSGNRSGNRGGSAVYGVVEVSGLIASFNVCINFNSDALAFNALDVDALP